MAVRQALRPTASRGLQGRDDRDVVRERLRDAIALEDRPVPDPAHLQAKMSVMASMTLDPDGRISVAWEAISAASDSSRCSCAV